MIGAMFNLFQMQILVGENNEILRNKSQNVTKFDKALKKLIIEMKKTMEKNKGIGLAAPQVGVNQNIVIVTLDQKNQLTMINPEILNYSDKKTIAEEGCLSLPGVWGNVERAKEIKVKFNDEKNRTHILVLKDLNARIVQHEIDHLEGVLFTDKIIQKNLVEESFAIGE